MSNESNGATPAGLVLPDGDNAPASEQVAEQTLAEAELARLEAVVMANYVGFAQQLGAILTLLASMPLEVLLRACERRQRVSILTMPKETTPAEAMANAASLRADEKIIRAAIALQQTHKRVMTGGAA